jgi:hypothetical protein
MTILTPNHSLKKPENTDNADLKVFVGENMDTIDAALATKLTKDPTTGQVKSADIPIAGDAVGGIKVGNGLMITEGGYALVRLGQGLEFDANALDAVGVKIGTGLQFNATTGALEATGGGGGSTGTLPKTKAYQTSAQSFPSGAWTKINYQAMSVDVGGGFDNTLSEYTVQETGIYNLGASVSFNGVVDAQRFVMAYYVNGTSRGWIADTSHSRGTGSNGQIIVAGNTLALLTAGQKLSMYCYTSAATSTQIVSGSELTTIYAYLLS